MTIEDPLYKLTERERNFLKKSWAEEFSNKIFPLINEDKFSVLYSDNPASRPNSPINVVFGLHLLKEMYGQSDEEALNSLLFDTRYQYALHTTSFEEQPASKNTLSNFRCAVYKYNEENNIDLIQEEMERMSKEFTKILSINGNTIRMDSLMVSSSCRKLSRLEIIFSTVERMIKAINKQNPVLLSERLKEYLKSEYRNDTIYRSSNKDVDSKLKTVTTDAIELYYLCKGESFEGTEEFNLLSRMIGEQTIYTDGNIDLKPSKEIAPESLQNPTDPDATYRKKSNKSNVGYSVNVVETFDDKNSIISQYDLKQNTYSDQKFSKDTIDKLGEQDEEVTAIADGAYYSEEISKKASKNNIKLVPTNLVGRSQSSEKSGYEDFEVDEKEQVVKKCPQGHEPEDSTFKNGSYRAHFKKGLCSNCPDRDNCPVIKQKKKYLFEVSETKYHRSKLMKEMETKEYKNIARKRAGVEGIPSILRRIYNIDHLPVRGLVRSKTWLGFKIGAINCKRVIKALTMQYKDALDSTFFNHFFTILSYQCAA
jgi:hypothetical protein